MVSLPSPYGACGPEKRRCARTFVRSWIVLVAAFVLCCRSGLAGESVNPRDCLWRRSPLCPGWSQGNPLTEDTLWQWALERNGDASNFIEVNFLTFAMRPTRPPAAGQVSASLHSPAYYQAFTSECMTFQYRFRNVSIGTRLKLEIASKSGTRYSVWNDRIAADSLQGVWLTSDTLTLPRETEWQAVWQVRGGHTFPGGAQGFPLPAVDVGPVRFVRCSYVIVQHDLLCSFASSKVCGFSQEQWSTGLSVAKNMRDATGRRNGQFFLPSPNIPFRPVYRSSGPVIAATRDKCLHFSYRSRRRGTTLRVLVYQGREVFSSWEESDTSAGGPTWGSSGLPLPDDRDFRIVLEASMRSAYSRRNVGRVGMDDIIVIPCHKETSQHMELAVPPGQTVTQRTPILAPSKQSCLKLSYSLNPDPAATSHGVTGHLEVLAQPVLANTKEAGKIQFQDRHKIKLSGAQGGDGVVYLPFHPTSAFRFKLNFTAAAEVSMPIDWWSSVIQDCSMTFSNCDFNNRAACSWRTSNSEDWTTRNASWTAFQASVGAESDLPPPITGNFLWSTSSQTCHAVPEAASEGHAGAAVAAAAAASQTDCSGTHSELRSPVYRVKGKQHYTASTATSSAVPACLSIRYSLLRVESDVYAATATLLVKGKTSQRVDFLPGETLGLQGTWREVSLAVPSSLQGSQSDTAFQVIINSTGYLIAVDELAFLDRRTCNQARTSCQPFSGSSGSHCQHYCHELQGGVVCSCQDGYALVDDNVTCAPVCNPPCGQGSECVSPDYCRCPATSELGSARCTADCFREYSIGHVLKTIRLRAVARRPCTAVIRSASGGTVAMEIVFNSGRQGRTMDAICRLLVHRVQISLDRHPQSPFQPLCQDKHSSAQSFTSRFLSSDGYIKIENRFRDRSLRTLFRIRLWSVDSSCTTTCGTDQPWWKKCCYGFLFSIPKQVHSSVPIQVVYQLPAEFRSGSLGILLVCFTCSNFSTPTMNATLRVATVAPQLFIMGPRLPVGAYTAVISAVSLDGDAVVRQDLRFSVAEPAAPQSQHTSLSNNSHSSSLVNILLDSPPCAVSSSGVHLAIQAEFWWGEPVSGVVEIEWTVCSFDQYGCKRPFLSRHKLDSKGRLKVHSRNQVGGLLWQETPGKLDIRAALGSIRQPQHEAVASATLLLFPFELHVLNLIASPLSSVRPTIAEVILTGALNPDKEELQSLLSTRVHVVLENDDGLRAEVSRVSWEVHGNATFAVQNENATANAGGACGRFLARGLLQIPPLPHVPDGSDIGLTILLEDEVIYKTVLPLFQSQPSLQAFTTTKVYSAPTTATISLLSNIDLNGISATILHANGSMASFHDNLTQASSYACEACSHSAKTMLINITCDMAPAVTVLVTSAKPIALDTAVIYVADCLPKYSARVGEFSARAEYFRTTDHLPAVAVSLQLPGLLHRSGVFAAVGSSDSCYSRRLRGTSPPKFQTTGQVERTSSTPSEPAAIPSSGYDDLPSHCQKIRYPVLCADANAIQPCHGAHFTLPVPYAQRHNVTVQLCPASGGECTAEKPLRPASAGVWVDAQAPGVLCDGEVAQARIVIVNPGDKPADMNLSAKFAHLEVSNFAWLPTGKGCESRMNASRGKGSSETWSFGVSLDANCAGVIAYDVMVLGEAATEGHVVLTSTAARTNLQHFNLTTRVCEQLAGDEGRYLLPQILHVTADVSLDRPVRSSSGRPEPTGNSLFLEASLARQPTLASLSVCVSMAGLSRMSRARVEAQIPSGFTLSRSAVENLVTMPATVKTRGPDAVDFSVLASSYNAGSHCLTLTMENVTVEPKCLAIGPLLEEFCMRQRRALTIRVTALESRDSTLGPARQWQVATSETVELQLSHDLTAGGSSCQARHDTGGEGSSDGSGSGSGRSSDGQSVDSFL